MCVGSNILPASRRPPSTLHTCNIHFLKSVAHRLETVACCLHPLIILHWEKMRCGIFRNCPCLCFSAESRAAVLRVLTLLSGLLLIASGVFAISVTMVWQQILGECKSAECDEARQLAVEAALGSAAIHLFLIVVGAAVAAAEAQVKCVAKYLGFLCYRTGRGVSLIVCGLVSFSYSRSFVQQLERWDFATKDSSLTCTVAGAVACSVGALAILLSFMPPCCECLVLPADALAIEFTELHRAARNARRSGDLGAGGGGGGATSTRATGALTEMTGGGLGFGRKSSRKQPKAAGGGAAGGCGAGGGGGAYPSAAGAGADVNPFCRQPFPADQPGAPSACDKPFPTDNPFCKPAAPSELHQMAAVGDERV